MQRTQRQRILCIWFPHWPVQRIRTAKPELKNHAIAIAAAAARGQSILACDAHAERAGLRPGMPLAEALSLAASKGATGKAPVHIEPYDAHTDRLALCELAAWCEKFSPRVGVEEAAAPESLLLDVTGLSRIFGSEEELSRLAARKLAERQYVPRLAIADTVGAAWAVAHYHFADEPTVVSPGETKFLLDLPIEGLRLPAASIELLHQLGVIFIGEVVRLSRASLKARFGPELLLRLDQLTGRASELIQPQRPTPQFNDGWSLECATTSHEAIETIISVLLERLTAALRARQQGISRLECRLALEGRESVTLVLGLYRPTCDVRHLFELIQLQLERQRLAAPVSGITLEVTEHSALTWRQGNLFEGSLFEGEPFDGRSARTSRELALLVNRLSSRLGRDAVLGSRLRHVAVPEHACAYLPYVGIAQKRPDRNGQRFLPDERPLNLLLAPQPVEVVASAPDGPPAAFFYRRVRHELVGCQGPERIESAWWRGRSVRRDYYRVQTASGEGFWLFRRLHDLKWFLHGHFD